MAGVWLVVAGSAGCGGGPAVPRGARLSVRWTGADTAEFSAHAVAEWCPSLHLLEVRAVAGDTGVGIVLYAPDSLTAGVYPIRRPDVADTTLPPSAAVALRWFSKTTVMGFQSDSGSLTLEHRPGGTLAGRLSAVAHPLVGTGRLRTSGTFEDLRVVAAPADCARHAPGDTAKADTAGHGGAQPDSSD